MRQRTFLPPVTNSAGFTLIEIMLVMAITSLLAVIAFTGQHALEARATFDSQIDATVQQLAYARNYAESNVNIIANHDGPGDTLHGYDGGPVETVGDAFEFDPDNNGYLGELETTYAAYDASGNLVEYTINPYNNYPACNMPGQGSDCEAHEEFFDTLPVNTYSMSKVDGTPLSGVYIIYINTGHGLKVCTAYNDSSTSDADCAASAGTIDVVFTSTDGFKATIEVDGTTGLPRRLN